MERRHGRSMNLATVAGGLVLLAAPLAAHAQQAGKGYRVDMAPGDVVRLAEESLPSSREPPRSAE
jgi:hypothetical protein